MEFQRLLAKLANFPVKRWFTKELPLLSKDIQVLFASQSAVLAGGVTSGGTISASALGVSTTAATLKLNGQLKAVLAALADVDLFTTASTVGQAVYLDGTTAAAITLPTDNVALVVLIATDSDGAGAATGDNGAAKFVAVTDGPYAYADVDLLSPTLFPTDAQIAAALEASTGVHAGTTGFVRLANILWDQNGGSPTATVFVARDA